MKKYIRYQDYDVKATVQCGIDWLEANDKPNWADAIVLKDFDIRRGCNCVLGFCFRNESQYSDDDKWFDGYEYATALEEYEDAMQESNAGLGFNTPSIDWTDEDYDKMEDPESYLWTQLQDEWVRRIEQKRAETEAAKKQIEIVTRKAPQYV